MKYINARIQREGPTCQESCARNTTRNSLWPLVLCPACTDQKYNPESISHRLGHQPPIFHQSWGPTSHLPPVLWTNLPYHTCFGGQPPISQLFWGSTSHQSHLPLIFEVNLPPFLGPTSDLHHLPRVSHCIFVD